MGGLLQGELIKARTTRTALGFAIAAVLLGVVLSVLTSAFSDPGDAEDLRQSLCSSQLVFLVVLVYGAVGATGEFRHRTITGALLIAPDRLRVFAAKLVAYFVSALVLALVLQAASIALGALVLDSDAPSITGAIVRDLLVGGAIACGLGAALGVAVGQLVRNQVAAIIGSILFILAIEPAVTAFWDAARPYTIGESVGALCGAGSDHHFSGPVSALVLLAWTTIFVVAAAALDRRRDVT